MVTVRNMLAAKPGAHHHVMVNVTVLSARESRPVASRKAPS